MAAAAVQRLAPCQIRDLAAPDHYPAAFVRLWLSTGVTTPLDTHRAHKERKFRHPGQRRLPDRQVLCGILYVLHTGIQWEYLP